MGKDIDTMVPFPGALLTAIDPPWLPMVPITAARPIPRPACGRVVFDEQRFHAVPLGGVTSGS
jgi:hypothetical protein